MPVSQSGTTAPAEPPGGLRRLDLRIKVEEGLNAVAQLRLNTLPAAFQDVHRHLRLVTVLQRHRGRLHTRHLIGGQQTHSIHQHQICHGAMVQGGKVPHLFLSRYNQTSMSETATIRDTVILGSGCAGLTAAIYAARSNLKPLVLEGHEPGGQLSITTLVENFPGWPEGVQGPELIENMKAQATRFGAELKMAHLSSVDLSKSPIELTAGKETILTRSLIIASGASARWLNLPSEQALIGFGVSSCATCDGFFASGKEIAVIGGGDSAMEEALFLTRFATKVTLINRSENFRASRIMLERAVAHPQIEFLHNTVVEECLGVEDKDLKGLKLLNTKTGERWTLPVSFMFLGIGHIPNASAFQGQIDLDADHYIKTEDNVFVTLMGERVPGVFACGDVQDRRYRQAITAAGSGCMAALEVEKYLEELGR